MFNYYDHYLRWKSSFNVESWEELLREDVLSDQDEDLLMKGLQEHPKGVNQINRDQQTPLMRASLCGNDGGFKR